MATETVILSSYHSLENSRPSVGILRNNKNKSNSRPMTQATRRHRPDNLSTSIVRLSRHDDVVPFPVASYYHSSTFPSLYATFSTDRLRKSSIHLNAVNTKKHVQFRISSLKPTDSIKATAVKIRNVPAQSTLPSSETKPMNSKEFNPKQEQTSIRTLETKGLSNEARKATAAEKDFSTADDTEGKADSTSKNDKNVKKKDEPKALKPTETVKNSVNRMRSFLANPTMLTTQKGRNLPSSAAYYRSVSLSNIHHLSQEHGRRLRHNSMSFIQSSSPMNKWKYDTAQKIPIWESDRGTSTTPENDNRIRPYTTMAGPMSAHYGFVSKPKHRVKSDRKNSGIGNNRTKEAMFVKYYSSHLQSTKNVAKTSKVDSKKHYKSDENVNIHDYENVKSVNEAKSNNVKFSKKKFINVENILSETSEKVEKDLLYSNHEVEKPPSNDSQSNQPSDQTASIQNVTSTTSVPTRTNLACRNSSWHVPESTKRSQSHQLLHRPYSLGSISTAFLTPEQLVIRESVEKVQRWMRSLPKHFDTIHHVLPPVQQDY